MPRQRPNRILDIVPIANLASLLIPVGLMVTQFVALQWMGSADTPLLEENLRDAEIAPILPVVEVDDQGFRVLGAESVLAGPNGRPRLPCANDTCTTETYDYAGLGRLLGHVKDAYPWADTVVVHRRSEVPYDVLVRTVDAVRRDAEHELFPRVRLR